MMDVNGHTAQPVPWSLVPRTAGQLWPVRLQLIFVLKSLELPLYLRAIFMVLAAHILLVMVWSTLLRTVPLPEDLFSAYEDIFPGQSKSVLLAGGFSCHVPMNRPDLSEYCTYMPRTGPFSMIIAIIEHSRISRVDFAPRENHLRVGDLVLLWGSPRHYAIHAWSSGLAWYAGDLIWFISLETDYTTQVQYVSVARRGSLQDPTRRE